MKYFFANLLLFCAIGAMAQQSPHGVGTKDLYDQCTAGDRMDVHEGAGEPTSEDMEHHFGMAMACLAYLTGTVDALATSGSFTMLRPVKAAQLRVMFEAKVAGNQNMWPDPATQTLKQILIDNGFIEEQTASTRCAGSRNDINQEMWVSDIVTQDGGKQGTLYGAILTDGAFSLPLACMTKDKDGNENQCSPLVKGEHYRVSFLEKGKYSVRNDSKHVFELMTVGQFAIGQSAIAPQNQN